MKHYRYTTHLTASILSLVTVVLVVVNVILANEVAPLGDRMQHLDRDIDKTKTVNELLAQQVASASSLIAIEKQAEMLGFTRPLSSAYLTLTSRQFPVALGLPR